MIFETIQGFDLKIQWKEALEQWGRVTDTLGQPIDPGILETVAILNLLSLQTTGSCEGHLESGLAYPWIDLEATHPDRVRREAEWDALNDRFMELCERNNSGLPIKIGARAAEFLHQREAVGHEIYAEQHRMIRRLMGYLDQFYARHRSAYDRHLTLFPFHTFDTMRLLSVGGFVSETLSEEEKRLKLPEYQEEMRLFTEFLKQEAFGQALSEP